MNTDYIHLERLLAGWKIREFNGHRRITDGTTYKPVSAPAFNALRDLLDCSEKLGLKIWKLK